MKNNKFCSKISVLLAKLMIICFKLSIKDKLYYFYMTLSDFNFGLIFA
jgi:hypothetical protein